MSSSAPEQLDPAGPRGGLAGCPASRAGLPGRPVAGHAVSGRLPWMLVVTAPAGLAFLVLPPAGLLPHTSERLDGPAFVAFPPAVADLDLTPGRQIWASVKAAETRTCPA
ncbi:hypothetical protein ABT120_44180 [Nonomuraea angiospora]|uniref:hypothetical protein n=1 Tax=Nonomuraea angiospora TaxID=46172 RepID=UPI003330DB0C